MARPLRIEYSGALYHVISRGDRREAIVKDDQDRKRRLEWLARTVEQHDWRLHAFALMKNHEHLLVETPKPNLSMGMKLLNGAYTQYFNKRHRCSGHLFQGRFKAHVVEEEGHYTELSRYIHLNPVRAKVVKEPASYRWSSFSGYCRLAHRVEWMTYRRVLADFGPGRESIRRQRYARYVRLAVGLSLPVPWSGAIHGLLIGSTEFLDRVKQSLKLEKVVLDIPLSQAFISRPSLKQVIALSAKQLGVDPKSWRPGRRDTGFERALAAFVCRRVYDYSGKDIAHLVGYRDGGSVTRALYRVESDAALLRRAKRLGKQVAKQID